MAHPIVSHKKAKALSTALLLFGLAALTITEAWWPGIMLVIGIPLALRQYLLGRPHDMAVTLLIFAGTFVLVEYDLPWRFFLPTIFSVAAIYILFREYLESQGETEEEKDEDINHEIEEDKKK